MIEKIGLPSVWSFLPFKGAVPEVAMEMLLCPWGLGPNNLSVRKEVCDGPYVGHSDPQTLRVQ